MIVTLMSATGSPGVTTSALGLALSWPRPVLLVENSIGSPVLAGYGRGEIPHDRGLLSLLAGHRDGVISSTINLATTQLPDTQVHLIPGFTSSGQAGAGTEEMWTGLRSPLQEISASEMDVFVDAGRFGMNSFPGPLLSASDRVLLAVQTSLPSIAGARCVVPTVQRELRDSSATRLEAVVVGDRRPYSAKAACALLQVDLAGQIAWDPKCARVLSDGDQPDRKFHVSDLQRSLAGLAVGLQGLRSTVGVSHE